ncbi:MAG: pilus assembly protein [Eggerthellaceae bacterium]|nr:pilus assembly protein [Eggerthellaceae bacterium]
MKDEKGQSTVEAAFVLPLLMTVFLLMAQPALILYDKMVMSAAAAEACRLMATLPASQKDLCEDFVRRRLGAVPPHQCFHVHAEGKCSWEVDVQGDEAASAVSVTIKNKVKPLPLLDVTAVLLGLVDDEGFLPVVVCMSMPTQPAWVAGSANGEAPSDWVGDWVD